MPPTINTSLANGEHDVKLYMYHTAITVTKCERAPENSIHIKGDSQADPQPRKEDRKCLGTVLTFFGDL